MEIFLEYYKDGDLLFEPMAERIHHQLKDTGEYYARPPDDLEKDFEDILSYFKGEPIKNRKEWKADLDKIFKGFGNFLKFWIALS